MVTDLERHLAYHIAAAGRDNSSLNGEFPMRAKRVSAAYRYARSLNSRRTRPAALFKKPSQTLEHAINHGCTAAIMARGFIEMSLPIVVDGPVIGGIGASFCTPEHDVQAAQAGLAALCR
jgi:glc operon protein GlcG